jgi:hypothetical protein
MTRPGRSESVLVRSGSSPAGHRALITTTLHSEAANSGAKRETGRRAFESCRSPTGRKGPKGDIGWVYESRPFIANQTGARRTQPPASDDAGGFDLRSVSEFHRAAFGKPLFPGPARHFKVAACRTKQPIGADFHFVLVNNDFDIDSGVGVAGSRQCFV